MYSFIARLYKIEHCYSYKLSEKSRYNRSGTQHEHLFETSCEDSGLLLVVLMLLNRVLRSAYAWRA